MTEDPVKKPKLVEMPEAGPTSAPPDPFDLASLRLNPSFLETAGVKKLLTTVPVRRPSPQDYNRVHPDPTYRENFNVIELKDDREDYLVRPELVPELAGEITFKTVYTAINRQGVVFLWPVKIPGPDERRKMDWLRSAREAAEMAMQCWIRVVANMSLGAYEMIPPGSVIADPVWPELSYQELNRPSHCGLAILTVPETHPRRSYRRHFGLENAANYCAVGASAHSRAKLFIAIVETEKYGRKGWRRRRTAWVRPKVKRPLSLS
jgi:hypothetical protein